MAAAAKTRPVAHHVLSFSLHHSKRTNLPYMAPLLHVYLYRWRRHGPDLPNPARCPSEPRPRIQVLRPRHSTGLYLSDRGYRNRIDWCCTIFQARTCPCERPSHDQRVGSMDSCWAALCGKTKTLSRLWLTPAQVLAALLALLFLFNVIGAFDEL